MRYKIEYDVDIDKALQKVPKRDAIAIREAIEELAKDPKPVGSIKLSGRSGYRVRVRNYRVVYEIFDDRLIVLVLNVDGRKDIYR